MQLRGGGGCRLRKLCSTHKDKGVKGDKDFNAGISVCTAARMAARWPPRHSSATSCQLHGWVTHKWTHDCCVAAVVLAATLGGPYDVYGRDLRELRAQLTAVALASARKRIMCAA